MSEKQAKKNDERFDNLLKIARGNILNDYLESLKTLPRAARGFSIKADLKMCTNGRGIGVFAGEFLPAGKKIDTNREHAILTQDQAYVFLEEVPNDEQRRWWLEHIYCLDNLMKCDMVELDTMMVNHSDNPTVVTREDGYDYTTRDVNIGEELTEDYRTYDTVPYYEELCRKYSVKIFDKNWK